MSAIEKGDIVTRGRSKLTWEVRHAVESSLRPAVLVWYVLESGQSGRLAVGFFTNLKLHTKRADIPTHLEGVT